MAPYLKQLKKLNFSNAILLERIYLSHLSVDEACKLMRYVAVRFDTVAIKPTAFLHFSFDDVVKILGSLEGDVSTLELSSTDFDVFYSTFPHKKTGGRVRSDAYGLLDSLPENITAVTMKFCGLSETLSQDLIRPLPETVKTLDLSEYGNLAMLKAVPASIETLIFQRNINTRSMSQAKLEDIFSAVPASVRRLDLSCTYIFNREHSSFFSAALKTLKELAWLSYSDGKLDELSARDFELLIASLQSAEQLKLSNVFRLRSAEKASNFAAGLKALNARVKRLDLSDNYVTADMLKSLPCTVEEIDLSNVGLGRRSCDNLSDFMLSVPPGVRRLVLLDNDLDPSQRSIVFSYMPTTIEELMVERYVVSDFLSSYHYDDADGNGDTQLDAPVSYPGLRVALRAVVGYCRQAIVDVLLQPSQELFFDDRHNRIDKVLAEELEFFGLTNSLEIDIILRMLAEIGDEASLIASAVLSQSLAFDWNPQAIINRAKTQVDRLNAAIDCLEQLPESSIAREKLYRLLAESTVPEEVKRRLALMNLKRPESEASHICEMIVNGELVDGSLANAKSIPTIVDWPVAAIIQLLSTVSLSVENIECVLTDELLGRQSLDELTQLAVEVALANYEDGESVVRVLNHLLDKNDDFSARALLQQLQGLQVVLSPGVVLSEQQVQRTEAAQAVTEVVRTSFSVQDALDSLPSKSNLELTSAEKSSQAPSTTNFRRDAPLYIFWRVKLAEQKEAAGVDPEVDALSGWSKQALSAYD